MDGVKRANHTTGNAGLHYAGWQLSRRGWVVSTTARNSRGADMFIANSDETLVLPVQIKVVGPTTNVSLGSDLARLTTPWWIIVSNAYSAAPICYVMTLKEVKDHAYVGKKDGSCWLQRKLFTQHEYEEAWDRLRLVPLTLAV